MVKRPDKFTAERLVRSDALNMGLTPFSQAFSQENTPRALAAQKRFMPGVRDSHEAIYINQRGHGTAQSCALGGRAMCRKGASTPCCVSYLLPIENLPIFLQCLTLLPQIFQSSGSVLTTLSNTVWFFTSLCGARSCTWWTSCAPSNSGCSVMLRWDSERCSVKKPDGENISANAAVPSSVSWVGGCDHTVAVLKKGMLPHCGHSTMQNRPGRVTKGRNFLSKADKTEEQFTECGRPGEWDIAALNRFIVIAFRYPTKFWATL